MNLTEQYQDLLKSYTDSSSQAEKEAILARIDEFVETNKDEFPEVLLATIQSLKPRVDTLRVREILEPIIPIINLAYIAENYFHKSRSYFSQRINGAIVNGQPATFKPEEIKLLAEALQDISKKIAAVNFDGIINH